ncbi:MAG: hypothetical protein JWO77_3233 [Ilumatobacteraceae bacterium]|nr:hypothetical protein [Ilumatobacteraceae bacterium]
MARLVRMLVAIAVLVGVMATASLAAAPASAEVTYGDIAVDDVGGHVFVTYGDTVRVYDLEGAYLASIPDQLGASDLQLRGRTLYVLAQSASRVNKIDADTLAMTGGWSLSSFAPVTSITWTNSRIWFSYGGATDGGIGSLDPATGTVVANEMGALYSGGDISGTESPARVYVLDRGSSPSKIHKFDITTNPPTFVTSSPHSNACSNGRELALAPDGTKAWTACGSPYKFNEFDPAVLGEPTKNYPATNYPAAVAVSADGGYLVGGTDSIYGLDVWLYRVGTYSTLRSFELGDQTTVVDGMVAVSNGGVHVYAVGSDGALRTWTLAPRITVISPNHVTEGTTTQVTITGTALGDVTSASVGGTTVTPTVVSDTAVKITVPAGLTVGSKAVVLTSAWGSTLPGAAAAVTVDPQKPGTPEPPVVTGKGERSLTVSWTAPADHGHPITGYTLRVYEEEATDPLEARAVTGTSAVVSGLVSEQGYRFTVAATSSAGTGGTSAPSDLGFAGIPDLGPHLTLSAFVTQQHLDLVGRAPSTAERSAATDALARGDVSPEGLVVALRRGPDALASVDPMARLYRATFLRIPDRSGLDYWIAKKRKGAKLTAIAESFARSSEFTRRYGSLTDRKYVERLYLNVLGRAGDAGGIEYWTGKLTRKVSTRGQVLVGMSESNEYKRTQASEVDVAVLYVALLRRAPTSSEFTAAVADLDGGGSAAELARSLLDSAGYAARF